MGVGLIARIDVRGVVRTSSALALLVLASWVGAPARAELLQLDGWSTGQTAVFQGGFVAGETAAVRLVPTGPCPCQVDEVRFLFGGAGTSHNVTIRIWDDSAGTTAPGAELYSTTVNVTGTVDFMQSVDLRAEGITVTGPFRVGLQFSHAGFPSVPRDDDGNIDATANFIDAQGFGWVPSNLLGLTGDWVIRAVVDGGTLAMGTELANDGWTSGGFAGFQAGFVAGEIAAARLIPPGPCPCRLDTVRFLFGGAGTTHDVILRVWDDSGLTTAPGAEFYAKTVQLTGTTDFMQEVDISEAGLMIDGPVRIGLEFTHAGLPSVARDDDGISADLNYIDASGIGWTNSNLLGLTGDWIIRAVIDSVPVAPTEGTVLANDGWLTGEFAGFQAGFVAGETAAVRLVPDGPCPCPVTAVRFLFGGSGGTESVMLKIWDDNPLTLAPGAELYATSLDLTGTNDFMQEVDITIAGVVVSGPFRVGLQFSHAGTPSVARDDDGIMPDRNFIDAIGLGWVESSTLGLTGDWIIRAVTGGESESGELLINDGWVNGQPAGFQAGFVVGETAAVRFVPTGPCPCQLDQIRLLFGGATSTETVTLRVWDDSALTDAPGAELYSDSIELTGSEDFMQELDLTVEGITVNGPFRVGFEFSHSGTPSVARDDDGIRAGRNFISASGIGWVESSMLGVTGDWIVRSVVDSVPGTLLASDSYVAAASPSFQMDFVATETAAVRFDPEDACPCELLDVRFLFGGDAGTKVVTLRVWDDSALNDEPGAEIYSRDVALEADDQVLQVVDLSGESIVVGGPYRVGIEFQHGSVPSVAADDDGITAGRNFMDTIGVGWVESSTLGVSGDWILRSTVELPAPPVPGLSLGAALLLSLGLGAAAGVTTRRASRQS
jgi:hypothetical protein